MQGMTFRAKLEMSVCFCCRFSLLICVQSWCENCSSNWKWMKWMMFYATLLHYKDILGRYNLANEINFVMKHATGAGSFDRPVDQHSRKLPLCYGCPLEFEVLRHARWFFKRCLVISVGMHEVFWVLVWLDQLPSSYLNLNKTPIKQIGTLLIEIDKNNKQIHAMFFSLFGVN